MKKTKRMFVIAALACGMGALTACANNPDGFDNPATTNAADGRRITDVTTAGNGIREIGEDIAGGAENLATDLGIQNNSGTERITN